MPGLRFTVDPLSLLIPPGLLVDPPIPTNGLEGLFILGQSLAASAMNRIEGKPNATPIGAPALFDSYAQVDGGSAFFRTGTTDFAEMTLFVVAQGADTEIDPPHEPVLFGTSNGAQAGGASIYRNATTVRAIGYYQQPDNTIVNKVATVPLDASDTSWRLFVACFGADKTDIKDLTAGAAGGQQLAPAGATRVTGGPLCIGANLGSTFQGLGNVALAGVYSRQISDAERDGPLYAGLQGLLHPLGLMI